MGRTKFVTNERTGDVWNELSEIFDKVSQKWLPVNGVVVVNIFMMIMVVAMMARDLTARIEIIHSLLRRLSGENWRLEENRRNFRARFGRSNAHVIVVLKCLLFIIFLG